MEECIVLVIDEYTYLAERCKPISSMIQTCIDLHWRHRRLFLILCGSSMSFMENQMLGYQKTLYGRRTAQFKIKPITYSEFWEKPSAFNYEKQAILYGITGEIPEYLNRINPNLSMDETLSHFLRKVVVYMKNQEILKNRC